MTVYYFKRLIIHLKLFKDRPWAYCLLKMDL